MSLGNSTSDKTETTNITKTNTFGNEDVQGDVLNVGETGGDLTVNDMSGEAVRASQETASDALEENRRVAAEAFGFGESALDMSSDTVEKSLSSNTNAMQEALDTVQWQGQQNAQKVSRALDAVKSAKTSDGAETTQKLIKWGSIAAAGVAVTIALTR